MKLSWRWLLGISEREIDFHRRGFRGNSPAAIEHTELIGATFLHGYHLALEDRGLTSLMHRLEAIEPNLRGFCYEGAAMGVYLLDRLSPRVTNRFGDFVSREGRSHIYMAYVGAGWAHARLPFGLARGMARLDPLLRWLLIDGYGFHEGFFHWPNTVEGTRKTPARLSGYARRVFDHGLGRSIWFVDGHDAERIACTISQFSFDRRPDLWAGIGLAATYAGGASSGALLRLWDAAESSRHWVAQGAAFAAKARAQAGSLTDHTDEACKIFCGSTAIRAAAVTDEARRDLPADLPHLPAYEVWRQRISEQFCGSDLRCVEMSSARVAHL